MKRFTKTLFIVLVAVAFVATGCKKESEYTYKTVTLGAKIAPGNSKVYIYGYTPKWNGGDVVNVNGNPITVSNVNGASAELHDVTESDDGYYAYYPAGDVTGFNNGQFTVTLPAIQEYEETTDANSQTVQLVKAPMGAKTDGGSLTFHNLCSLLKVTVTVDAGETLKIAEIKVTAGTTNLSGSTSINLSEEPTYVLPAPATGSKSVTLSFGNSGKTLEAGNHVFYIYLPAFTSQDVSVEVYNIDANSVLGVKKKTFNNISVSANTINTVGTGSLGAASFTTTGAISGLFSVSSTKQVRFSKGNLQYNNSNNGSWKFAENQYDYCQASEGTWDQSGWVDLFGWGTWTGSNPNPTRTDNNNQTYSWDNLDFNKTLTNATGNWRTLRRNEWSYLIDDINRGDNRYLKASITVGNTSYNGLILFPDNYDGGIGNYTYNNETSGFTTVSEDDWVAMETIGAVFLPAAGIRYITDVFDVGYFGSYWSSSPSDGGLHASTMDFDESIQTTGNYEFRYNGMSVRLVQDAN